MLFNIAGNGIYLQGSPYSVANGNDIHNPVAVWGSSVNLQVFTDGTNSDADETNRVKWVTSATLDETETPQPRTWHWPERD